MTIQKPWHKVYKWVGKGYRVVGVIYWDCGRVEAILSK